MMYVKLPDVGDLITFSNRWELMKGKTDKRQPVGLITDIITYNQLLANDMKGEVYGTLAYPITIDIHVSELSRVYIVKWATSDQAIISSYSWINEEWFHNESFIIISKG